MTVQDAILIAAAFLSEDEAEAAILNGDTEAQTVTQFLRCANLVIEEIAAEYMPLITKERISVKNGSFLLSELSKRALNVYALRRNGEKQSYFCRAGLLTAADGEYEIEYSFLPEKAAIGDPLPFDAHISARVVAYGIAAEYALISGLSDEAATFDKRYKDALNAAKTLRTEKKVKQRVWL